jgi:hypothetical protein
VVRQVVGLMLVAFEVVGRELIVAEEPIIVGGY